MLPEPVGDEVRFGVAIGIPEPHGAALQAARRGFGDPLAFAIPPHITLLGPSVRSPEGIARACVHLEAVAASHPPFTVRLRGTGTFRPISPVVFVQLATGIADCEQLESAVRSGPLAQRARFNYHPHVTVAHEVGDDDMDRAFAELAGFDAEFEVTSFQFYNHGSDGIWRPGRSFELSA